MSQYATLSDLTALGLPPAALSGIDNATRTAALVAASATADSYLGKRFALPILEWGADLTRAVVSIASWDLLSRRGFNPASGADVAIRQRFDDAVGWLRDVARGLVEPAGLVDTTQPVQEGAPLIESEPRQAWAWPTFSQED